MRQTFLTDKDREEIEAKIPKTPLVTLTETAEGVKITLSDKNGVQSVTVKNGEKGEPGAKGSTGAKGEPGKDGKTPVLGVDYFTPSEKAAIVADVIASLPIYNGEAEGV